MGNSADFDLLVFGCDIFLDQKESHYLIACYWIVFIWTMGYMGYNQSIRYLIAFRYFGYLIACYGSIGPCGLPWYNPIVMVMFQFANSESLPEDKSLINPH